MPVIIKPSPEVMGRNTDCTVNSADGLLQATGRAWSPRGEKRPIIQSSFRDLDQSSTIIPFSNGLVNGIIRAFEQDLHLALRPDDIWISILTQFSMFVNGGAERLRAHFVAHERKKELIVDISPLPVGNVDMGKVAQEMTRLIQENVVDIELSDWIIPNFSTTTDNDKSVAAIVMMGTLQCYFDYVLRGGCGFPSVTLLGERSDWEKLLHRVQRLPKYGNDTSEWCRLLVPIIKHMIESFDVPNSQRVKDFWLRACHSAGSDGSGDTMALSGWVTAFCFWSETGSRILGYSDKYLSELTTPLADRKRLILDGIAYPIVKRSSVPKGVVSVPIAVKDLETGLEHKTVLVAGCVGMTATAVGTGKDLTKVQPRSGWWMLEESVKPISNF